MLQKLIDVPNFYLFSAEKTQIQQNRKFANWMQTRERVTKIINVGIIVQQEVLVNCSIGEDALEIGNFETP